MLQQMLCQGAPHTNLPTRMSIFGGTVIEGVITPDPTYPGHDTIVAMPEPMRQLVFCGIDPSGEQFRITLTHSADQGISFQITVCNYTFVPYVLEQMRRLFFSGRAVFSPVWPVNRHMQLRLRSGHYLDPQAVNATCLGRGEPEDDEARAWAKGVTVRWPSGGYRPDSGIMYLIVQGARKSSGRMHRWCVVVMRNFVAVLGVGASDPVAYLALAAVILCKLGGVRQSDGRPQRSTDCFWPAPLTSTVAYLRVRDAFLQQDRAPVFGGVGGHASRRRVAGIDAFANAERRPVFAGRQSSTRLQPLGSARPASATRAPRRRAADDEDSDDEIGAH